MTINPVLEMRARLRLEPGDELLYDCPSRSMEDADSDAFFRKYGGQTAIYICSGLEVVGPLDFKGRAPGLYCKPDVIGVRFPDGLERVLNIRHFVALAPREADESIENVSITTQRLGDLIEPIVFYQGDQVSKVGDLLAEPRVVKDVQIDKDRRTIHYTLDETAAARTVRLRKREERRSSSPRSVFMDDLMGDAFTGESAVAGDLQLIERGNVYRLYHEPEALSFSSVEDELSFWFTTGISKLGLGSFDGLDGRRRLPWTLAQAIEHVESGAADLIRPASKSLVPFAGYDFGRVFDLFGPARERARATTLSYWRSQLETVNA